MVIHPKYSYFKACFYKSTFRNCRRDTAEWFGL